MSERERAVRRRRQLRREQNEAERLVWSFLRRRRLGGLKFRRQHPLGPFITDFYCAASKLIVELDGSSHDSAARAREDRRRQHLLEARGLKVMRFLNDDVYSNLEAVLEAIFEAATGRKLVWGPDGPEDPEDGQT
jgi:very-short-patch-repair endonuclease